MKQHLKMSFRIFLLFSFLGIMPLNKAWSQSQLDSLFNGRDTTAVIDSLMQGFDAFLDSLSKPKSMFNVSLGVGSGLFSFEDKSSVWTRSEKKWMYMPSLAYYHKSGLGLSAAGYVLPEAGKLNMYQWSVSPSYDLIKSKFSAGLAYSHYFTKDSVDFYVTPIQNELYTYFAWKKAWIRPAISVSYGWGSQTSFKKREWLRLARLLRQSGQYNINRKEEQSIEDFSVTLSVRKNIDWYDVISSNDNITITPVLLLNAGTQRFGFNRSYSLNNFSLEKINALPSNSSLSSGGDFALQSASAVLRASYMKGVFAIQPQVYFDYVLWDTTDRFSTVYSILLTLSFP